MYLYLKFDGQLEDVARYVASNTLQGWDIELREGLNLGGGEYYKFERLGAEVILVCNDADHAEVFIEERKEFPFYFHWRDGGDEILEEIRAKLIAAGVVCELHEDT